MPEIKYGTDYWNPCLDEVRWDHEKGGWIIDRWILPGEPMSFIPLKLEVVGDSITFEEALGEA